MKNYHFALKTNHFSILKSLFIQILKKKYVYTHIFKFLTFSFCLNILNKKCVHIKGNPLFTYVFPVQSKEFDIFLLSIFFLIYVHICKNVNHDPRYLDLKYVLVVIYLLTQSLPQITKCQDKLCEKICSKQYREISISFERQHMSHK